MKRLSILTALAVMLMATPVMAMPWPAWGPVKQIFWWFIWHWFW